jgi:protein disulfide-isomerase A1
MVKQSLPAVTVVTGTNHGEFKEADKIVVLAYLESSTESPAPVFAAIAEKHRDDYLFGLSTDSAVATEAVVTPPAVVVYRKFDDPRVEFKPADLASFTEADLETFLKENSMPLIDEIGPDNYASYSALNLPLGYLFVEPEDPNMEEYIAELKEPAKKHRGQISIVYIDAVKFVDHAKSLNLKESKWPAFVIQDIASSLKYPMEQTDEYSGKAVAAFLDDWATGKIKPKLKSQPVPESQNESVFVLVGSQFDEVAYDESKDVFVEFYAPWCGHCKRLKPTWDSLGDHYVDIRDRVVIAKMDATENDLPGDAPFRVTGFPTLKFKPAGSREFIDYDGDRTLESLIEFVDANAKNSLTPPVKSAEPEPTKDAEPAEEEASVEATVSTPVVVPTPEAQVEFHDEL